MGWTSLCYGSDLSAGYSAYHGYLKEVKSNMKKVSDILLKVFAYGIIACLFAGGLSLAGYLIGLVIGGASATKLSVWVFKTYLPWVIKVTSLFTGIGLLGMYLGKKKALTATVETQEK